jgi:hypothetical protein
MIIVFAYPVPMITPALRLLSVPRLSKGESGLAPHGTAGRSTVRSWISKRG